VQDPSKNGREQGYTTLDALRDDPVSAKQSLRGADKEAAGC
jgi:hypothetical protein